MMTHEQIERSILELRPDMLDLRSIMDEVRRLPEGAARKFAQTGMFRLLTPRAYNGAELNALEFFETLSLIAQQNASVAWCAMIASTNGISAAYMAPEAASEIFSSTEVITGGVFAPRGKAVDMGDYYKVSGRWAWGSGSANCNWLAGGCTVWRDEALQKLPDGKPDIRMMFFPVEKAQLHDTWNVMGLRGTGSGDFEVTDVNVPKTHSVSLISESPIEEGTIYRFPIFGLLALGIAGVAVGNGRAAINEFQSRALTKQLPDGAVLARKAYIQTAVAELEADWQSTQAYIRYEVQRLWDMATECDEIPIEARAALRLACTKATRVNAEICRRVYELGGGDAMFADNHMERYFRDGYAMTQHIMTGQGSYEMIGRIMLDQPVNISMV